MLTISSKSSSWEHPRVVFFSNVSAMYVIRPNEYIFCIRFNHVLLMVSSMMMMYIVDKRNQWIKISLEVVLDRK